MATITLSPSRADASPVDATVLICTFNRAADLEKALACTLAQDTGGRFSYEVLVVDNNSTDDTRQVVERFVAAGHSNLRYLFEGRQGRSHALALGVAEARGGIYALSDDDVIVGRDWLRTIVDTFSARPDVAFVGGKVMPLWEAQPRPWLTPRHWSAIALSDYGDRPLVVDRDNQICLLAASFRSDVVRAIGGYRENLGVSKDKIGGTEDVDLFARLYRNGYRGLYLPTLVIHHKVAPNRTTKSYHRRWHVGHGRFYAVMRADDIEVGAHRLFDVPAHLFRQAVVDALGWLTHAARGRFDDAFWYETRLRFFYGFLRERRRDFVRRGGRTIADVVTFVRSFAWRPSRQARSAIRRL
jgi:glucosyl-dolichyl phosphate glucuronosyltransferase